MTNQTSTKRQYVKPQLDRQQEWQLATGSTVSRWEVEIDSK